LTTTRFDASQLDNARENEGCDLCSAQFHEQVLDQAGSCFGREPSTLRRRLDDVVDLESAVARSVESKVMLP